MRRPVIPRCVRRRWRPGTSHADERGQVDSDDHPDRGNNGEFSSTLHGGRGHDVGADQTPQTRYVRSMECFPATRTR
jgi:hypothetical protein